MNFFKRILCPIDFDDNSLSALRYARDLARSNDATLYVMNAVFLPPGAADVPPEYPAVSDEPGKLALHKLAEEHLQGAVQYQLIMRIGEPADMIRQVADEVDADLIVIASHGKKGMARLFLGSVAEDVVRTSARPVLIIRPKAVARA